MREPVDAQGGAIRSRAVAARGRRRRSVSAALAFVALAACRSAPSDLEFDPDDLAPGITLSVYAEDVPGARIMAFGPDTGAGSEAVEALFVSGTQEGSIFAVPDRDADGVADATIVFAEGLDRPHGIAWRDGWLYVGETHRVVRMRDVDGDLSADEVEIVVPQLPAAGQHFTRSLVFGPDGGLYVSVGSSCNACEEDDPRRAAVLRFDPDDGEVATIYARGLRNAVGLAWHPTTGALWATDNGRDWLGDELPPEELNRIQAGDDHGWPFCYGGRVPDPEIGSTERCASTVPATFEMQAHSAPLGLDFYTGSLLPAEYRGDLFIAFHGSWNRSAPTGYKVVRVRFSGGEPTAVEDFVDVWLDDGSASHRPVDVKTGPDGALYISDDLQGTVFRVTPAGR
jgi:glucose/arabinose dehydrogenase